MLLAIDVGNTNIVLGVFDGERLAESWRLATMRERTADEPGILVTTCSREAAFRSTGWTGIILVIGRAAADAHDGGDGRTLLRENAADGRPRRQHRHAGAVLARVDVGADRVVNAVAAYEAYGRAGRTPVIVVDFGTATTFDAISATGEYIGGVICPGIGISADALFQRAARLPRVDVRKPPAVIGRTTVDFDAVGAVLWLCRDGRWDRRAHAGRARKGGRAPRASRPAGWPQSSRARVRQSRKSIRT